MKKVVVKKVTKKKVAVLGPDNIESVLAQAKRNDPKYRATLIVLGKKYTAGGDTVLEALGSLTGFGNIKGKVIISVEHDGVTRERVFMPSVAFRMFSGSRMAREISLKQTASLFF